MRARLSRLTKLAVAAGARPLSLNLLASAALLAALAGSATWAVLVPAGAALLWLGWLLRGSRSNGTSGRVVGQFLVARTLLLAGALVLLDRAIGFTGVLTWLTILTLLFGLLAEPVLATLDKFASPLMTRLPGAEPRWAAWFPISWVPGVQLVALALLLAAGTSSWALTAALVVGLADLALAAVAILDAALRIVARLRAERRLPGLLAQYGPRFVLHWQAPAGTAYQVGMWLPYLERLGVPFFVLVRTEANFHEVRGLTSAPVVLRPHLEQLDEVVTDSMSVAFYVNTAVRNCHLVRFTSMTHIQLNHGDSDKAPSFNPVFRMFDKDFVAGQAAIDRFAANGVRVPAELFEIVGRPQVEDVAIAERPIGEIERPTVLYAPTWSGFYADSDYSSLRVGPQIVDALLARGCRVVFRPHPYARRSAELRAATEQIIATLEADRARTGREHVYGPAAETEMSVVDCINASDALISDVSSVVADYLYSEKPFVMAAVSARADAFTTEFPLARAAYVLDAHGGRLSGLDPVLDDLLGSDPRAAVRRELKTYYLGDIPAESYADRFLETARRYLG